MGRRHAAAGLTAAALCAGPLALAACGSDGGAAPKATATASPSDATTNVAAPQATSATASGVRLVKVGQFKLPDYLAAPPGDRRRLFVVEQGGTIRVVRDGKQLTRPFLDLRSKVIAGGEQGLLSIAFAPDYATSRRFYVNYTDRSGTQSVVEYRRSASSPDRASAGSARLVLRYDGVEANHNGGLLLFGPDKLLYVGTGDGGGANDQHGTRGNGQDRGSLLGKLLRIDPRRSGSMPYSVPSSNPFVGEAGARPEIYSYGLRNPWRFSFDRATGDLAIGDVGQDHVEEIDFARKGRARGANYGWRPLEGTRRNYDEPAPNAVSPVLQMLHSDGNCSVTGGYVVRDRTVPALLGRYVYGDFCKGQLRSAKLSTGAAHGDAAIAGLPVIPQLSSFGEDARGRVYVVSLSGPVYRFAAG
ncbi:MAG TPA: PQQ-dependent sugar dehydrogenase [Solirubrobacteraceae bacterium]|nr:PQQ-dependent sugar dehydrogenase [Solirubrobacteraceae bacterium]